MTLFKRRVYVEYDGVTLPSILTTEFDINFSEKPDVDTGNIKIYNLSKSTVNRLKKGKNIRISAGYEGDYGNIFYGEILNHHTSWQGVDKVTEITLGDSNINYRKLKYSKSFAPNTDNDEVIRHLVTRAGLGIGDFQTVKNRVYKNGLVVSGPIQNSIKKHIAISGSKSYIKKGRIYIRPQTKGNRTGFELNKDTGLVDIPEPIETEIDEKIYKGFNVTSLLNHQLEVDSIILIKSKTANGYFRVSNGTHQGSNQDGDFYTTMEVYPI